MASLFETTKPAKVAIRTADNGIMVFDAVTKTQHQSRLVKTKHPVENNANISDHTIKLPEVVTLSGVVTNHPLSLANSAVGAISTGVGSALTPILGSVAQFATARLGSALLNNPEKADERLGGRVLKDNQTRNMLAYQILQELQVNSIPVSIVTGLKVYENMILTNIETSETTKTSHALVTSATFEEIQIVSTQLIDLPKAPKINGSKASNKKGTTTPKAGTDAEVDATASKAVLNVFEITTPGSGN